MTSSHLKLTMMIFAGALLMLGSCTTVTFDQSLPQSDKVYAFFPAELRGEWVNDDGDGLSITASDFSFEDIEGEINHSWELKIRKNQYFLNQEQDGRWTIIVGELVNSELKVYWFSGEDEKLLKRLKKITPVKEVLDENGDVVEYQVNPTEEEFEKILSKRVFTLLGTFTKD